MVFTNCRVNEPNPNITWIVELGFNECVQQSLLLWLPGFTFLLALPFELYALKHRRLKRLSWTKRFTAKLAFLCVAVVCLLVLLASATIQWSGSYGWRWTIAFSYGFLLAIYIISIYMSVVQEKKRAATSVSTLLMLFVSSVTALFKLIQSFLQLFDNRTAQADVTVPVGFIMFYVSTFVALILASFSSAEFPSSSETKDNAFNQPPWPEEYCSTINRLCYSWFSSLVRLGYRKTLEMQDVWYVSKDETTRFVYSTFGKLWQSEFGPIVYSKRFGQFARMKSEEELYDLVKTPSLMRVITKCIGWQALGAGLLKLFNDILLFIEPFIVKIMIGFYMDESLPSWHGYMYVVIFAVLLCVKSLIIQHYFNIMSRIGVDTRTAIVSAVYRKALRLTSESRAAWTAGEIVNLVSVDASRFRESSPYVQLLWSAPFQIILGIVCLYMAVGHAVWAGVGFLLVVLLANAAASKKFEKLTEKQMAEKDKRMKLLTEILNGIKVIKLYAWEPAFQRQLESIRWKELKCVRNASYIGGVMEFAWNCTGLFTTLIIFAAYIYMYPDKNLTAETVFFVLAIFNIIDFPLVMLPHVITSMIMLSVSVKRLSEFFSAQEQMEGLVMRTDVTKDVAVKVYRSSFTWKSDEVTENLSDINFEVPCGKLYAVVGPVGCGKSSLLLALTGEMHRVSGFAEINGSIAYVAQQAWIQNTTFRNNVLFGKEYQSDFYDRVVDSCALKPDLQILTKNDQTEIGERGVNLSGGQKLRLCLARAVYQDRDVYLLDDPLSAVDTYVGKHLFDKVIGPTGMLRDKTRILVTHDLRFLSKCDAVLVMEDGRIIERVESAKDSVALAGLLQKYLEPHSTSSPVRSLSDTGSQKSGEPLSLVTQRSRNDSKFDQTDVKQLKRQNSRHSSVFEGDFDNETNFIAGEALQSGNVAWSVYMSYLRASGLGLVMFVVLLALAEVCTFMSVLWMQVWTDSLIVTSQNQTEPISESEGLTYFAIFACTKVVMAVCYVISFACFQVHAAKNIHSNLLNSIVRAPMQFFDSTPTGRIVNRCGKDINTIDNEIPSSIDQVTHSVFMCLEAIIGVIYATPWFALAITPLICVYCYVQRYYVRTARQLRRLEAITRSPVFSHFHETLHGVSTIRAFGCQQRFIEDSCNLIDANNSAQLALLASNRWVGVRLEVIGVFIVVASSAIVVAMRDHGLTPGLVGMAMAFSLGITGLLSWGVQQMSILETEIVAVERINGYISTPSEGEWTSRTPIAKWPLRGGIEFRNYSARYRLDMPLVLRNLSIQIKPGDKVGVIGRTGAGKTSLTMALFRLLNASEGGILIDEIDIASIGLHDLRKRLSIIPQDPVLFTGTVRFNLDPFDEHSDETLWSTLELCQLKSFVTSLPKKLNYDVSEGGGNLSVGQRQLVCLARALLRKSKIVLMDEATASVDAETDNLVHKTIQTNFKDCTVITIAHRLSSVRECNSILVLENGKLVESGDPNELLQNTNSYYSRITRSNYSRQTSQQ